MIIMALVSVPAIGDPVTLEGEVIQPVLKVLSEKDCLVLAIAKARHDLFEMVGAEWAKNLSSKGSELTDEKRQAIYALARGLLHIQIMKKEKISCVRGSVLHIVAKVEYEREAIWEPLKRLNAWPTHLKRWQNSRKREEELLARLDQIEKQAFNEMKEKQTKQIIECLKAVVWNEKALRIWPEEPDWQAFGKALAFINKAIELDPTYYMLYLNRGDMFAAELEPERALCDYGQAIKLNPRCAGAYSMMAIIYAGWYDRADLACPAAIKACELGDCTAFNFLRALGDCTHP